MRKREKRERDREKEKEREIEKEREGERERERGRELDNFKCGEDFKNGFKIESENMCRNESKKWR